MRESEIIKAIEFVVSKYPYWIIGITDDPIRRKEEHGNPTFWFQWRTDSEAIARRIEKYCIDKGMKGAPGGGESPNYVYIFLSLAS